MGIDGKTFFCGVGVQKAGTTWLYDYLAARGDVYLPKRKELHYFDNRHREDLNFLIESETVKALHRRLERLMDKKGREIVYDDQLIDLVDRLRMEFDETAYGDFFSRRVGDQLVFGEITPSYCFIGVEGLKEIRGSFEHVRIIYLMRDPIDRHYSALRMIEGNTGQLNFARRHFRSYLSNRYFADMAAYHRHYADLTAVFERASIFVGFYETLFCNEEIARLCDFLGIPFLPGNYDRFSNRSNQAKPLRPEMLQIAREKFDETYRFCKETFGDKVPASWKMEL